MVGGQLAQRLKIKKANALGIILGATVSSLVAAGVVAAITVSNMLIFGPVQVGPPLGPTVTLTEVQDLPSSITTGEEHKIEFSIEADALVTDAALWLRISADGTTLSDPTIVAIEYEHPSESWRVISLASSGGNLEGELKTGWEIPEGYDETAKIKITFDTNSPAESYSLHLWAEGSNGTESNSTAASSRYQVLSTDDETFSPEDLTISVGDGVEWTSEGKAHTVTFSDPVLPSKDYLPSGDTFYVVFDQAGTFPYICEFHDGMVGTVTVLE